MSRKVLPLKGTRSLRALNAFNALLLGYKFLPEFMGLDYDEFYSSLSQKTEAEKETVLRKAVAFVELKPDEVDALISFATDKNGVAYGSANQKNLDMAEIFEIVISVCMEIGRIQIDLVSANEKKKSLISL